jgi:hypothetical protein
VIYGDTWIVADGKILQVATCLGTNFDDRLIFILWEELSCEVVTSRRSGKTPHELLVAAIEHAFVEPNRLENDNQGIRRKLTS